MKSNYKRLGDYIEPCVEKNSGNLIQELQGISNQKFFQKAKTNTIGVDLTKYRIVRTGQFAFNRATTRNGDKISIALRAGKDCIVSPSYRIFKSKDENLLNSEFLMMWFLRPEFDRYARFKSHGSAHEFFDLDEMSEVYIPLPSIERQRELVQEYNTIVNRIRIGLELQERLMETAQNIYKYWFIDHNFPNKNEEPYYKSGGEFKYCDLLKKEIPIHWSSEKLENHVDLSQGIQVDPEFQFIERKENQSRFLRIIDYTPGSIEPPRYIDVSDEKYICNKDEIVMIRYGYPGKVCRRLEGVIANNLFKITPRNTMSNNYLYYFLRDSKMQEYITNSEGNSKIPAITHGTIKDLKSVIPSNDILEKFDELITPVEKYIQLKISEIEVLKTMKFLLLSKISKDSISQPAQVL